MATLDPGSWCEPLPCARCDSTAGVGRGGKAPSPRPQAHPHTRAHTRARILTPVQPRDRARLSLVCPLLTWGSRNAPEGPWGPRPPFLTAAPSGSRVTWRLEGPPHLGSHSRLQNSAGTPEFQPRTDTSGTSSAGPPRPPVEGRGEALSTHTLWQQHVGVTR